MYMRPYWMFETKLYYKYWDISIEAIYVYEESMMVNIKLCKKRQCIIYMRLAGWLRLNCIISSGLDKT